MSTRQVNSKYPTDSSSKQLLRQYTSAHNAPLDELPASKHPTKRRFSFWRFIKRCFLLLLVTILLIGSWIGWNFYQSAAKITGDSNPLQLLSLLWPAQLNTTGGRVNILLAGNSVDDPNHQGAALTDSIMIVSINPKTKTAVLLSIPRDMWVDIPGFGYQKINAAYEDGQSEHFSEPGYASGGMGLLEEVIQQDFGVQSDYQGLLDYTAFRDAVNAVGGVTVTIQSPDPNGLYDPNANLDLPNGTITLNGQQALDLARARGDGPDAYGFPEGDFNRTQHQQQLLIALKNKAESAGVISNPFKIVGLINSVGNNFTTDMPLNVMMTIYNDTKGLNTTNIQSVTLNNIGGQSLVKGYITDDGEDALIPSAGFNNYTQIQSTIQSILTSN